MKENKLTGYPSIDKPWLKYYSEEEINYSIPKCKIIDNLYKHIDNYSNEIALEFMNVKVTYSELKQKIEHVAKSLKALGINEGDTISVCLPNMPESVYLFYAINKVGAVANMLDLRNSNAEFLRLLKEANTTYLFVMDTAAENFADAVKKAELKGVVAISVIESLPMLVRKLAVIKNKSLKANLNSLKGENGAVKKVYTQKICSSIANGRTENAIENSMLTTFHWHIERPELHFEYKIYW